MGVVVRAVRCARQDRVLAGALGLFALGNVATGTAASLAGLLAARAAAGTAAGVFTACAAVGTYGRHRSALVGKRMPSGITPMISAARSSTLIERPRMPGSPPNRRLQYP